jgi:hypothetical protein
VRACDPAETSVGRRVDASDLEMQWQSRDGEQQQQLSTTERELKDGRSRKSIYHWGARPLDFHPRGVQRPDAAARSNAAATWVRTYSGGWIDVAAQLDEAMALGLPGCASASNQQSGPVGRGVPRVLH